MHAIYAKVSESGRISLPAEWREAIGLERGGEVIVELDGNDLLVRTVDELIDRAQEMTRRLLSGKPEASLDSLLSHRRREARTAHRH
jgi:AbrB family looped-hinge helix DNA binding protein